MSVKQGRDKDHCGSRGFEFFRVYFLQALLQPLLIRYALSSTNPSVPLSQ
jgi:hypothetical protein